VVKAGEEVDLCPDAGFVSLYIFLLDDFEGNMTEMDEPDGVLVESERDDVVLKRHAQMVAYEPFLGDGAYEMTNQDINIYIQ